jgi:hypothetical protein
MLLALLAVGYVYVPWASSAIKAAMMVHTIEGRSAETARECLSLGINGVSEEGASEMALCTREPDGTWKRTR